jgi:rubrerythrin
MSDKHNNDKAEKESGVLWTFKCKCCGFVFVKLCTDKEPCPLCKKELVKTYFQFFN